MPENLPKITADAPLILASGSAYRAELLRRLPLPFTAHPADIDETTLPGETPQARAARLADGKAAALSKQFPHQWILGSDQVAALGEQQLGKPGTAARAQEQLRRMRGQRVDFWTAATLLQPHSGERFRLMDHTQVRLRPLSDAEIERYVALESPLDCAGSFKVEGAGICLFDAIESSDPTALIGLPLIGLSQLLRRAGAQLP